jgi:hypothetical protein
MVQSDARRVDADCQKLAARSGGEQSKLLVVGDAAETEVARATAATATVTTVEDVDEVTRGVSTAELHRHAVVLLARRRAESVGAIRKDDENRRRLGGHKLERNLAVSNAARQRAASHAISGWHTLRRGERTTTSSAFASEESADSPRFKKTEAAPHGANRLWKCGAIKDHALGDNLHRRQNE